MAQPASESPPGLASAGTQAGWSPEGSEHFRWALAPARTFFASAEVRSSERRVFLRVRLLGLAHAPGHACNSMLTRGPVSSICFRLCRR